MRKLLLVCLTGLAGLAFAAGTISTSGTVPPGMITGKNMALTFSIADSASPEKKLWSHTIVTAVDASTGTYYAELSDKAGKDELHTNVDLDDALGRVTGVPRLSVSNNQGVKLFADQDLGTYPRVVRAHRAARIKTMSNPDARVKASAFAAQSLAVTGDVTVASFRAPNVVCSLADPVGAVKSDDFARIIHGGILGWLSAGVDGYIPIPHVCPKGTALDGDTILTYDRNGTVYSRLQCAGETVTPSDTKDVLVAVQKLGGGSTADDLPRSTLGSGSSRKLASGIYSLSGDATFAGDAAQRSALQLEEGSVVIIELNNHALTATGYDAQNQTGAGAGIEVPQTATLSIVGPGTLTATGGNAADGQAGGHAADGYFEDSMVARGPNWSYVDYRLHYYTFMATGGAGGAGGGGAGAGIGGCGGAGGAGGKGKDTWWVESTPGADGLFQGWSVYPTGGDPGGSGEAGGSCGSVVVLSGVTLTAKSGQSGQKGGNGGAVSTVKNTFYYVEGKSNNHRVVGEGGGGGGGGAGGDAEEIGSGGTGGGGGGGGQSSGAWCGIGNEEQYKYYTWDKHGKGGLGGAGFVAGTHGGGKSDGNVGGAYPARVSSAARLRRSDRSTVPELEYSGSVLTRAKASRSTLGAGASRELATGTYSLAGDVSFTGDATQRSALRIKEGSTVILELNGHALTATGYDAQNQTGAGAGIEVPETARLYVTGPGTLTATGGKAANGQTGGNGHGGQVISVTDAWLAAGGDGGAGGGGAGAGIGGCGGAGGAGGKGQDSRHLDAWGDIYPTVGNPGESGRQGGFSGSVVILSGVTLTATGGPSGQNGGAGGQQGGFHEFSDGDRKRCVYESAGGGGGGSGGAAEQFGSGGTGGGGGGGGSCSGSWCGNWTQNHSDYSHDKWGRAGSGGAGAVAGSSGSGNSGTYNAGGAYPDRVSSAARLTESNLSDVSKLDGYVAEIPSADAPLPVVVPTETPSGTVNYRTRKADGSLSTVTLTEVSAEVVETNGLTFATLPYAVVSAEAETLKTTGDIVDLTAVSGTVTAARANFSQGATLGALKVTNSLSAASVAGFGSLTIKGGIHLEPGASIRLADEIGSRYFNDEVSEGSSAWMVALTDGLLDLDVRLLEISAGKEATFKVAVSDELVVLDARLPRVEETKSFKSENISRHYLIPFKRGETIWLESEGCTFDCVGWAHGFGNPIGRVMK